MSNASSLSRPPAMETNFRRVAILFAGGPAPAANAVISAAAISFLRNGIEVVGMKYGYSGLIQFGPDYTLEEGRDYLLVDQTTLRRTRNSQGILIGTARDNPGKLISCPAHLEDAERSAPLRAVYEGLCSLGVDALISIGGDDTLKTANKLKMYQDLLPQDAHRIPIVHLPKTIDNDYTGIDFTFGYFTAVETLAEELRNVLMDAEANKAYFLAETMGRSAGWLAYGAAIAGEASLVISVEDIVGKFCSEEEVVDLQTGNITKRPVMHMQNVIARIVDTMRIREEQDGKQFGVIVIAEGLAELLPQEYLEGVPRDDHGHISIAQIDLGRQMAQMVGDEYTRQTGNPKKMTPLQLGYESRCSKPHAYDVMLGSQLGVGAYRALVEDGLNGVMVSIKGQLELTYVPFKELVNPETLVTTVRYIQSGSDFQMLARFLETYVNER